MTTHAPHVRWLSMTCLALMSLTLPLWGLEGGVTADDNRWNNEITHEPPSDEERATERAAREAAIAADIARLNERLQRVPDEALQAQLHARLQEIIDQNGWVPELEMVFGIRDITPILENDGTLPTNFVECIVQLREDLAARGIDLIFVPLPPSPMIYSHQLVDGIEADHEYTPGWTRMLLTLLEHDIEVIDPLSEYRAHVDDDLIINWPNDFHTADGGRLIAARMIAERLQRYAFARELAEHRDSWQVERGTTTVHNTRISVVNSRSGVARSQPDAPALLADRSFEFIRDIENRSDVDLRRSELVLIGDSQLHSSVYGAGFPEIIMSQVGAEVRWGSRSGGVSHSLADIYPRVVPDYAPQPRVVVVTCLAKYFWDDEVGRPRAMLPLGHTDDEGIPTARFRCTIELTGVSERPTDDPQQLDYQQAFVHLAARVVDGPEAMVGREIGVRTMILRRGRWIQRAVERPQVGQQYNVMLWHLPQWIANSGPSTRSLMQQEVFDTLHQDLTIPVFMMADHTFGWSYLSDSR